MTFLFPPAVARFRRHGATRVGVLLAGLVGLAPILPAGAAEADAAAVAPAPERRAALVRMVRQDCGSCHGMTLKGGLGPALTPAALADKPMESLAATVFYGRKGTPMPPWSSMLSEAEATWVVQQLIRGFPDSDQ
jgi:cytochrome c55X